MSDIKISKRYAKALFDFAKEQNLMDQIKADIDYLDQLCMVSEDFVKMLKSPVIKVTKKMEIIRVIMQNQISDTSMKFLEIISKGHREVIIPSMNKQFLLMHNELIGLKKVELYSAATIDNSIKSKIITILEEQTKNKIEIDESIQENLIGGFVLKIDDLQFDASIKAKLSKLKHELSQEY